MMCSKQGIPITFPTSQSLLVICRSSSLGAGSPLGWLWMKISPAVMLAMAGLNTSRGCTRLDVMEPMLQVVMPTMRFLLSRCTTRKLSTGISASCLKALKMSLEQRNEMPTKG